MGVTLDQLVFDTANPDDGANVGAYVRAGDDGTAIGHVGDALKVDIGSVTDLDIRDLSASQDNVAISDGTEQLEINVDGSINSVVSATDLDIRDLSASQDSVSISDGTDSLEVNADGSLNAVVSATDLDIRDLNFSTDSVTSRLQDGSGNAISSTAGALDVNLASGVSLEVDLDHTEDSVRLGDGTTLTDVTADNRLEVYHAPDSSAQNSTATVGTSAVELAATPLANRKKIIIQNQGNKAIYLGGSSGVTTANGICVPRGASFELDWGENVDVFAISGTAGQDVRVMEVA